VQWFSQKRDEREIEEEKKKTTEKWKNKRKTEKEGKILK
jgi:hypothetical protein